jgi:DNA-nicking Smr family endonuclease
MSKPKKTANPADVALFRAAMDGVKPLRPSNRRAPEPAPKRKPRRVANDEAAPAPLHIDDVAPVESGDVIEYARSGVPPNTLRRMRRGRVAIQATLDLHGLTGAGAQQALRHFLDHCISLGYRQLRIVHGKGRGIKGTPPVIKSIVNHWLREQPAVLAFCSAPPQDGGVGAVYVLLKSRGAC